jgi:hypothetical protein
LVVEEEVQEERDKVPQSNAKTKFPRSIWIWVSHGGTGQSVGRDGKYLVFHQETGGGYNKIDG